MAQILVLRNPLGDVLRVFPWARAEELWTVFRKDTRRIEVVSSLQRLKDEQIPFDVVEVLKPKELEDGPLAIYNNCSLQLEDRAELAPTLGPQLEEESSWLRKGFLFAVLAYCLLALVVTRMGPTTVEELAEKKEEKKREIVKIVRKKISIPKAKTSRTTVTMNRTQPKVKPKAIKKAGWKRRGALAALGQLNASKQKGGLNLGAMETSAGPGLGGKAGSGGVQTNLYGKGLVAAPLGAGQNIKGGGGYGTKGKGGGKAGFGSVSLIGATGASLIPIPSESTVEGGLSSETIADVVRRNLGQVRFCYEKGLQQQPGLSGRVNVAWTIDSSGGVKIANVKNTSLKNATVENCILQRLKTWKFPLPQNRAEVKVSYPFLLKRVGAG